MNNLNKKIYSLDLLRGIAGYGVAITHYLFFVKEKINFEFYSYIFVEIFFILSGFVLFNQLNKVYKEKKNLKIFYLRRWYRTIPLYLVALIFFIVISNSYNFDFFKYILFIQKIAPDFVIKDYFMVAWSLSIEELFYLFFPLYLIFLNRFDLNKISFLFIIFFIILKLVFLDNVNANFLRTGSIFRLDAIAIGFLLALHYKKILIYKKFINIIFVLSTLILFNLNRFGFEDNIKTLIFIFSAEFFGIFALLFFINLEPFFKNKNLINFSGLIASQTYSVYLFHLIIMHIFLMTNIAYINNILVYLIVLFFISSIIYKYFELPILKQRPKYEVI